MSRAPEVVVGAAVVRRGEVLLVRRKNPPLAGEWSLIGGRLGPGETLEEAVVREVREETGLAVWVVEPLGVVVIEREGFAYAIHEHLCVPRDPQATPYAGDDALEARWAALGELRCLGVRQEAIAVAQDAVAKARLRVPDFAG